MIHLLPPYRYPDPDTEMDTEEVELGHTAGYPLDSRLSAKHEDTFGRITLVERLPKVLSQITDTVHRYHTTAQEEHGQAQGGAEAVKSVVHSLSQLRYEMQTNKTMQPIKSGEDVQIWDRAFQAYCKRLGAEPVWFSTSWMFFECYMYRKVMEILHKSEVLKDFDPFREQKVKGFFSALEAMTTVGEQVVRLTTGIHGQFSTDKMRAEFTHLVMLCLWGNKADLSMSVTMDTYDTTHHTGTDSQTVQLSSFILTDHTEKIWELLTLDHASQNRRVDFILDNAGFELFCDLCFAEWLLCKRLVNTIVLHCKQIPWFISDTNQRDVRWTLEQLSTAGPTPLAILAKKWKQRLLDGSFVLTDHSFWTTSYVFSELQGIASDLHTNLSQSHLLIFKGDLNYRKLVGDRNWSYTTSFSEALQGFHPTNICSLRTLKADLVAGLPPGAAKRAASESKDWMITGKYAVIQVHKI